MDVVGVAAEVEGDSQVIFRGPLNNLRMEAIQRLYAFIFCPDSFNFLVSHIFVKGLGERSCYLSGTSRRGVLKVQHHQLLCFIGC